MLVIDEAPSVRHELTRYLSDRQISVTALDATSTARELIERQRFDAVLLDIDVESGQGTRLARYLGARGWPPLVILSSRSDEIDRIIGFEMGADDYLTKPVGLGELYARLLALWRRLDRASLPNRRIARVSGWHVDLSRHTLRDAIGAVTMMTYGEAALLSAFLHHPLRVLNRAELLQLTHHDDAEVFDRTIDVLVARLRKKLEEGADQPLIETIRGRGYRFTAPVEWEPQPD